MNNKKTILVLAPHTDDGELGCGGYIAKSILEGHDVHYIAFSTADESVPKQYPSNQLEIEVKEATAILGIKPENLYILKHTVRKLNYVRQEILDELIHLRDKIHPNIVLLPTQKDIHQDHKTVTEEGIRAFKNCSILGYELIWNNLEFASSCFVPLEKKHIDLKIASLAAYKTQEGKSFMNPDFIRSMACVRGTQINVAYAEAFEVIRWIL